MEYKLNNDYLNNLEKLTQKLDSIKLQKMIFIFNALDEGWSIKKRNDSFIFYKNHEGKKEVLDDSYLTNFMKTNLDMSFLLD